MKKYVSIAVVALIAVIGSTVSMFALSAQEPASNGDSDTGVAAEPMYCDVQSDGITVQGSGTVTIPANIGVVELGVDVTAETVIDARSQAAEAMTNVIAAVKEEGIEDEDITTTQLNIWPETTWVEEEIKLEAGGTGRRGRSVVIGYRVSNRVRIEIDLTSLSSDDDDDDRDVMGSVIDAAASAGGDHARVDSIYFRADETAENTDEARQLAVADALHRAGLYADAFGVGVGPLLGASESVVSTPVFREFAVAERALASADSASTPVSVGNVEINASITAKFGIVQPGCGDDDPSVQSAKVELATAAAAE